MGQLAYILADGWVCSYKVLPRGTRQIVDFQVPGDFLGLRSVLFRTSDHNAEAMTRSRSIRIFRKWAIGSVHYVATPCDGRAVGGVTR